MSTTRSASRNRPRDSAANDDAAEPRSAVGRSNRSPELDLDEIYKRTIKFLSPDHLHQAQSLPNDFRLNFVWRIAIATRDFLAGEETRTMSPVRLHGETVRHAYGLARAFSDRLLSLRLDMGGMEVARELHRKGELRLVCAPPSGGILHMLVAPDATLPADLRIQLQPGTAVPRLFEVIYLSARLSQS